MVEREREFEGERMSGCERKKSKDILLEKRESLLINAQKINRAYDHTNGDMHVSCYYG